MNRDSNRNRKQQDRRRRNSEPEIKLDMVWQSSDGERPKSVRTRMDIKEYPEERPAGGRTNPVRSGRRHKKKHSFLKRLFCVVILLAVLTGWLWQRTVSTVYDRMNYVPVESLLDAPLKTDGVFHILLIGNDSREQGDDGRSDAMLLLSINNKTKKILMTSLLRDMYVEIPGHKNNRLNAAYSYGGAELLLETLKLNFGIEVNRYMLVNFQAFAHLVDAMGGVELELTNEEVFYVNGYLTEYNMLENRPVQTDYLDETLSGMIHLNGPQALAYCRNRYTGTDFARTGRQRKVLSALVKKAPTALLRHFGDLVDSLPSDLTTNLTKNECMRLSLQVPGAVTYEIVQSSIPVEGSFSNVTIDKMEVLQVDFEKNRQFIRQTLYGEAGAGENPDE